MNYQTLKKAIQEEAYENLQMYKGRGFTAHELATVYWGQRGEVEEQACELLEVTIKDYMFWVAEQFDKWMEENAPKPFFRTNTCSMATDGTDRWIYGSRISDITDETPCAWVGSMNESIEGVQMEVPVVIGGKTGRIKATVQEIPAAQLKGTKAEHYLKVACAMRGEKLSFDPIEPIPMIAHGVPGDYLSFQAELPNPIEFFDDDALKQELVNRGYIPNFLTRKNIEENLIEMGWVLNPEQLDRVIERYLGDGVDIDRLEEAIAVIIADDEMFEILW